MNDDILSVVYLLLVLVLILPGFIYANKNKKTFLSNLLIWSVIIGYLIFKDLPTLRTFAGIILVVGAGIFIFIREEIKKQKITIETPLRR